MSTPPYGVQMEGTGIDKNGKYIHWEGNSCFKEVPHPLASKSRPAVEGRTIATYRKDIPFDKKVIIEGIEGIRIAEDVGDSTKKKHIDVYYGRIAYQDTPKLSAENKKICVEKQLHIPYLEPDCTRGETIKAEKTNHVPYVAKIGNQPGHKTRVFQREE